MNSEPNDPPNAGEHRAKPDYNSPEFTEALSRRIHQAKQAALNNPGLRPLEDDAAPKPDYGSPEFTDELTRKFHQGTRAAITRAQQAGSL